MNRRRFLSLIAPVAGVLLVAPTIFAEQKRGARPAAGGGGGDLALPVVNPTSPAAKGVNYVHKHADMKNNALKTERSGVKWENQHCTNCGFYTKVGNKDGVEVGKCTIFANQLVHGPGWCSTWNKKA